MPENILEFCMSELDRIPQFMNVVRDARQEDVIRQAAGRAGLRLANFFTDVEVAAAVYANEGVRMHGRASAWDGYERLARRAVDAGGAVFRLTAKQPQWPMTNDQLRTFSEECTRLGLSEGAPQD